jgi:glycerol-3-phosphate acyltransferase PlsY
VAPLAAWFIATRQIAAVVLFLAVLIWLRHHQNIRRLLTGREPKIGQRKDA